VGLRDTPLAAFAELRLRLVLRRLRARGGVAELVARVLSYLVLVPVGLLFAGLMATGAYAAARAGRGLKVDVPLAAMFFGLWQAWTAVALSLAEQESVDLRRFLVYPLRPGRLYALGLAASVVGDPFSLFWCLLLGGAFAGAAAGRFGWWLAPYALLLLGFAAATTTGVALIQELAGRFLRGKRLRAVLIGLLYLGLAFAVTAVAGSRRVDPALLKRLFEQVKWLAWPAALAHGGARLLFGGAVLEALPWLVGLLAAAAAAGWGAYRLALAEARSGGAVASVAGGSAAGSPAGGLGPRLLGALPGRLAPLLERELKQLARHPLPGVLLLVMPGLAGLVAWKVPPALGAEPTSLLAALPLLGFALYAHVAVQPFWLNAFGWDRGGARLLLLAPLDLSEVLLAKNGATYAFSALLYGACAAAVVALSGWPPAWALVGAAALHLGVAPFLCGLGNVVSILNPRVASMALQRSGNLPALSVLAGMGMISAVTVLFALPVLLALRLDQGWVLPAAWGLLALLGLVAYRRTLPAAARLLWARREQLLGVVTGDDL
jgi:ABC-2 type transport system permease protein